MANCYALISRFRAFLFFALFASFCGVSSATGVIFEWPNSVMIRDATGAVRILDKPYGAKIVGVTPGGHLLLEGGMKIGIGTKATAAFELYQRASKINAVKFVRPFARLFGPVAIASMALDGIEWIANKWQKREDVDWTIDPGQHNKTWGCEMGHVGASTYTTFTGVGKVLVEIVKGDEPIVAPWSFGDYCYDLPRDPPHLLTNTRYKIVEAFPNIEDVPYREVTDGELEGAISDAVGDDGGKLVDPIKFGFDKGGTVDGLGPENAPDHNPVEGPSTIDGPTTTTTTTGPGGTTTTTSNTTYNITTNNNVINITSVTTTTTTKPDGSTETTETTETSGTNDGGGQDAQPETKPNTGTSTGGGSGNGTGTGTPPPAEPFDLCAVYPDILACAKLNMPDSESLPSREFDFSFTPAGGFGGGAACPGPITTTVLGHEVSMSWQPFCDALSMIKPLFLAIAWLSAAFILLGREGAVV